MNIVSNFNKHGFFFPTIIILLIVVQFIRPTIKSTPASGEILAPPDVKAVLKKACYDCHSNETKLGWADKISPVFWQVAKHVNIGRSHLNFSDWQRLSL